MSNNPKEENSKDDKPKEEVKTEIIPTTSEKNRPLSKSEILNNNLDKIVQFLAINEQFELGKLTKPIRKKVLQKMINDCNDKMKPLEKRLEELNNVSKL